MPPPTRQRVASTPSEADTCRKYVTPGLVAAGWDTEPHSLAEQRTFTAGRIVVAGTKAKRQEAKRADYLLRYTPDFTIAVVEAKPEDALPGDGLQQAGNAAVQPIDNASHHYCYSGVLPFGVQRITYGGQAGAQPN